MYELVNKHNHLLTLGCQRVGRATESVVAGGWGGWRLRLQLRGGTTRRPRARSPSSGVRPQGRAGPRSWGGLLRKEGRGLGGGGGVMAEAALDAVRRELREFPAAARGEWAGLLTAKQPQDAGGALGLPGTGFQSRARPGPSWVADARVHPVSCPQGAWKLMHVDGPCHQSSATPTPQPPGWVLSSPPSVFPRLRGFLG